MKPISGKVKPQYFHFLTPHLSPDIVPERLPVPSFCEKREEKSLFGTYLYLITSN